MSSASPSLTILSKEQKFNRDNLISWTTNMTQLLGAKGLLGYINGKITIPIPTQTPTRTIVRTIKDKSQLVGGGGNNCILSSGKLTYCKDNKG